MELSIIIPFYNVEKYIDQCLNSILKQNIPRSDYEIILIDDGSTDNSLNIAKKYTEENSNIQLFFQRNQGVSISRNNGLKYAKGKYLYFIDADDYIALDTLDLLLKIACYNNLDILEFSNIRTKSRSFENSSTKGISTTDLKIVKGVKYISSRSFHDAVWVYFYKCDFLLNSKINFYEGRTKQDMIFNAELIPLANKVAFYPLDTYRYVINPNSITTSRDSIGLRRSIEDFVFITIKYNELILKLINKNLNTNILKHKQQIQLFNIFKLLLQSGFNFFEINNIINSLSCEKLYPLSKFKGKNQYRKILTFLVNRKYLFFISILFYRIFRVPFVTIFVKNYQNIKEKKVTSSFN